MTTSPDHFRGALPDRAWQTPLYKTVRTLVLIGAAAVCIPSLAWGEALGPGQGKAPEQRNLSQGMNFSLAT